MSFYLAKRSDRRCTCEGFSRVLFKNNLKFKHQYLMCKFRSVIADVVSRRGYSTLEIPLQAFAKELNNGIECLALAVPLELWEVIRHGIRAWMLACWVHASESYSSNMNEYIEKPDDSRYDIFSSETENVNLLMQQFICEARQTCNWRRATVSSVSNSLPCRRVRRDYELTHISSYTQTACRNRIYTFCRWSGERNVSSAYFGDEIPKVLETKLGQRRSVINHVVKCNYIRMIQWLLEDTDRQE